jgi:hypothetical protein
MARSLCKMSPMSENTIINSSNWSFCRYKAGPLVAQIDLSAEPSDNPEKSLLYTVSVMKNGKKEVSVVDFNELPEAITYINHRYYHWTLEDQTAKKPEKEGGCATCVAH